MDSPLDRLISEVDQVKRSLDDNSLLRSIIASKGGEIVELNTQEQLFEKGINARGVRIDSYAPYANKTIYLKRKKGQPYDRVTLRDSGRFYKSFAISMGSDSFIIGSPMSLADTLTDKYGDFIFGLTGESKEKLRKSIILPGLLDLLRNELM